MVFQKKDAIKEKRVVLYMFRASDVKKLKSWRQETGLIRIGAIILAPDRGFINTRSTVACHRIAEDY